MKSRSGWKQWLITGLALVSGAGTVYGQYGSPSFTGAAYGGAPGGALPGNPAAAMAGANMYGLGSQGPMSFAVPGPAPMEVAYAPGSGAMAPAGPMAPMVPGALVSGAMAPGGMAPGAMPPGCACCDGATVVPGGCDGSSCGSTGCGDMFYGSPGCGLMDRGGLCGDCGGTGCLFCGGAGCPKCGGGQGCRLCGTLGGRLGCAPIRNLLRSTGAGAALAGTDGCYACGWGNNGLFSGRLLGLLGRLAPYSEGPQAQRWFDLHVGTLALARTDDIASSVLTTQGIAGTPVLNMNNVSLDQLQFGLLATACMQTGPGGNLEVTYFGLNQWHSSATALSDTANLYSVISNFGTNPPGGFDDTDQSINQSITYDSAIHNGEINFRRRTVAPARYLQGSWLAGVRYFDLDEQLAYQTVGLVNNGGAVTQRFFNLDNRTRNELVGFQVGGDLWATLVPGWMVGVEGKYGVYGNHAETDSTILANSVPQSYEMRSDGETAYLTDFSASTVYRLTYSWSFRTSYNYLRVDNVALAPRNFNTSGLTQNGSGDVVFGQGRNAFIDVNGVARYSGFSLGAEYLW